MQIAISSEKVYNYKERIDEKIYLCRKMLMDWEVISVRIDKICKTCGFDSNGVCGMYTTCKEGEECDDWEASLEYYTEITKKAPWYIKKPYDQCKISYEKFLDLLQQDEQGVGVEINIYDAIEKVYELNSVELLC